MTELDHIAALVGDTLGRPLTVAASERLSGGASARMTALDLRDTDGRLHAFVVRETADGSDGLTVGAATEATVLDAAAKHGVPVAPVVATFDGGYVMARLPGEALPRRLLRDEEYAVARARLLQDAAVALARIHGLPPDGLGLWTLTAEDQLDLLEATHRSFGQEIPVFELVLRWLRDRVPEPTAQTVVHGDFRLGNLLVDHTGLLAVLDWELVHLGDPMEDLGWFCAPAWRFGGPGEAGGLGSRDELHAAYATATGRPVDPAAARFWEVLATFKWGVICQVQAGRHLSGATRSVELAAIGRRVTEVELDLLLLTEEVA